MDAKQYERLRRRLKLSHIEMGQALGVDSSTSWRYGNGKSRIPHAVALVVEGMRKIAMAQ